MLTSRPLSGVQDSSSHCIRDQEESPGREVELLISYPAVMAERETAGQLILHTSIVPPDFHLTSYTKHKFKFQDIKGRSLKPKPGAL